MPCAPGAHRAKPADDGVVKQAREKAAEHAARDCNQYCGHNETGMEVRHADDPEVGRVPECGDSDQAGKHDGNHDQPAVAVLDARRQFLDGEHHAGQRRIEGGRDSGSTAGDQQAAGVIDAPGGNHRLACSMTPAAIWTDGPSLPMARPPSSPAAVKPIFDSERRRDTRQDRSPAVTAGSSAAITCGIRSLTGPESAQREPHDARAHGRRQQERGKRLP